MDETSQVPRKECLHVHKVSDCARFFSCEPFAMRRCCLLFKRTRSAPRNWTRFAAQYLARGLPCERFTSALTGPGALAVGSLDGVIGRPACRSLEIVGAALQADGETRSDHSAGLDVSVKET